MIALRILLNGRWLLLFAVFEPRDLIFSIPESFMYKKELCRWRLRVVFHIKRRCIDVAVTSPSPPPLACSLSPLSLSLSLSLSTQKAEIQSSPRYVVCNIRKPINHHYVICINVAKPSSFLSIQRDHCSSSLLSLCQ